MTTQQREAKNKYLHGWRARNREHLCEYQKKWVAASPYRREKARIRAKEWYEAHKARVAARQSLRKLVNNSNSTKRKIFWRSMALEKLGGKCVWCGYADQRALQFDHIHSDGAQDRKSKSRNNTGFYRAIAITDEYKDLIQILCCNCNWIKRDEELEYNQHTRVKVA